MTLSRLYCRAMDRRDERLAVVARRYIEDFTTFQPLPPGQVSAASPLSSRDHDAPSYSLLSSLR